MEIFILHQSGGTNNNRHNTKKTILKLTKIKMYNEVLYIYKHIALHSYHIAYASWVGHVTQSQHTCRFFVIVSYMDQI
jgi:hypothetical protein